MTADEDLDRALEAFFDKPTPQLAAALDAAARGWHVFPCGPDKAPLTPHGFKDASPDPVRVREFWQQYPAASVGVATGASGLAVVDLDCKKGKPGLDEWHRLKGELGAEIEDTTLVETPSGGMHVYYRANGHRLQSTAERIAPGIDTRAEGGYVIAAGSPGYLYVDGHGPDCLAPMPEALYRLACAAPARTEGLGDVEAPIPEGRRDSALASLAGVMRRRGLSPEAIYAALAETNRTRCRPPLTDAQVRKIAKSVGKYEPKVPLPAEGEGPHAEQAAMLSPFIDWGTFWQTQEQAQWLYPNVLALGRGHAIYAVHKGGKSLFALYMAAKLATEYGCCCLYVDYEMTEDDVRERLLDMEYGEHSDLSRLKYALLPSIPKLDTEAGGIALMELLDKAQEDCPGCPPVVIVDTISRAVSGEENSSDTWRNFYNHTGMLLKQRGVTWLRLDHGGKDAERGQRGSSGKGDDVDVVWKLVKTENGIQLKRELSRMAWVPDSVTLLLETPPLRYLPAPRDWPARTGEIAKLMDRLGLPVNAKFREAGKRVREIGEHCGNDVIKAALEWRREKAADQFRQRPEHAPEQGSAPTPGARSGSSAEQDDSSLRSTTRSSLEHSADHTTEQSPPLRGGHAPVVPRDDSVSTTGMIDGFDF